MIKKLLIVQSEEENFKPEVYASPKRLIVQVTTYLRDKHGFTPNRFTSDKVLTVSTKFRR